MSEKWSPKPRSLTLTLRKPTPAYLLIVITVCCLVLVAFLFTNVGFDIQHKSNGTPDIRILIGIMSPYWATARRQLVRNAYARFPKSLPIDIIFVEGNITAPINQGRARYAQHKAIEWENNTYGDILHLDCKENMNEGKTYEFLKKVGREFAGKYTHVMKSDDDAFINLPGM